MDSRLLNVLHNTHDHTVSSICDGVDIHLSGIFQKPVDQHGLPIGNHKRLSHVTIKLGLVITNFHCPSAEHKTRPDQHWKPNFLGLNPRFIHISSDAAGRLLQAQLIDQSLEQLPVFCRFNGINARSNNGHARLS